MPFDATALPWRAEVLTTALEILRKRGWCQGINQKKGAVCIYWAIREAGYHRNIEELGIPWPADFNDAPGRTFAEVEDWMLDRIAEAMNRGCLLYTSPSPRDR